MKQVQPKDVKPGKVYQVVFPKMEKEVEDIVKVFTALEESRQVLPYTKWYHIAYIANNEKCYFRFEMGHNIIWELE